MMDIEQLRLDTPGCAKVIHLNNAGSALMPEPVVRTIQDHIDLESRIGGYEAAAARQESISEAYESVATLIGTHARNIAFTENATAAYAQALSSVPFCPGDVILTTRNDYASNQIQFLSMENRFGVQVLRAPDEASGGVDVNAVREMIQQHRPRMVCVTHVPTSSGLVQDVINIGAICREHDTLYLVDACQSVGQMRVDVDQIDCDFLSVTSRKFLRGPRGTGFLYVSDRVLEQGLEPLFIDMRGADWIGDDAYRPADSARRFENWEFPWALVLATGQAARYAQQIGIAEIQSRVSVLATQLRRQLAAIDGVHVLDQGSQLCGIVTAWIDHQEPADLVDRLRQRGINTSAQSRSFAVLDYDGKGVKGALRISPHYYNTEDEIERTVAAIRELIC